MYKSHTSLWSHMHCNLHMLIRSIKMSKFKRFLIQVTQYEFFFMLKVKRKLGTVIHIRSYSYISLVIDNYLQRQRYVNFLWWHRFSQEKRGEKVENPDEQNSALSDIIFLLFNQLGHSSIFVNTLLYCSFLRFDSHTVNFFGLYGTIFISIFVHFN